jgi:DMSO/TMAO reductase YedYZ molybdopterin-dependent catalytic subunit
MPLSLNFSRRHFLLLASGGFLTAQDRVKNELMVRSVRPEDLEMPLSGFADYVTPVDQFFVRTHVYVPTVSLNDWRLKVDGEVATPLTLTMADLKQLPSVEVMGVLECAGNGRGFYDPAVPGMQWASGGVGNGRWRGVRLADVLKKAGAKDSAKEILFDGADVPLGTMPDFQRSIPVKKALDPNTLLAYEMNGETLPVKHGFPLRAVVPGWAGDSWAKWVTSIRVLDKEADGFWMKAAYRHPGKPVPPGTAVPPEQMQPVTSLRVKSVIASPADDASVAPGRPVAIRGAAWSGEGGPVTAVEVSVDAGRSWQAARLGSERSQFGWRQWEFMWTPQPGFYTVMARARDMSGDVQPLAQEWNPAGYLWNVVPHVHVNVGPPISGASSGAGGFTMTITLNPPPSFKAACLACHEEDMIRQQRLTPAQWDRELNKMTGWGAKVNPGDRDAILQYLSQYGPRR